MLAGLMLTACNLQVVELKPVDWMTVNPSGVLIMNPLVGQNLPEPKLVVDLRAWAYRLSQDAVDALDRARPAGILLPDATSAGGLAPDMAAESTDVSFPVGKGIELNVAYVGGCRMQGEVVWTANTWFPRTVTLAGVADDVKAGAVAHLRFTSPADGNVQINLELSDCLLQFGKCLYVLSSTVAMY
jgi:hypothetical protein